MRGSIVEPMLQYTQPINPCKALGSLGGEHFHKCGVLPGDGAGHCTYKPAFQLKVSFTAPSAPSAFFGVTRMVQTPFTSRTCAQYGNLVESNDTTLIYITHDINLKNTSSLGL